MPKRLMRILIGCCVLRICTASAFAQYTPEDLRGFAEQAVRKGTVVITKPEFEIQILEDGSTVFFYKLGSGSLIVPEDAAFERVVNQQLRVAVLRRFRSAPQQKEFWRPTLQLVEREIAEMLNVVQNDAFTEDQVLEALTLHEDNIEKIYDAAVTRAARLSGASEARPAGAHYGASYYFVTLSARPTGRVFYIAAGLWDLYSLAKARNAQVAAPEWNEVPSGDTVPLGGKYWFKATWDDGTTFRTGGPVTIRSHAPLEFTPTELRAIHND